MGLLDFPSEMTETRAEGEMSGERGRNDEFDALRFAESPDWSPRPPAADLPAHVTLTNVDIPFSRMVGVMLKWVCASLLALCIVAAAGGLLGFGAYEAIVAIRTSLH